MDYESDEQYIDRIDMELRHYGAPLSDPANHGDGSEGYALPWTTLTLLLVSIGAALVVLVPPLAVGVLIGGAAWFAGRWGWQVITGYSKGRKRRER